MDVEFRVLGGVEAIIDGQPVDLGHGRRKSLLAVLLVEANRPVPTDQLIDRAWGDRLPQRAYDTLYSYLSRMRRALAAAEDVVRISRAEQGYLLSVDPMAVDLHRFRALADRARTTDADAASLASFADALRQWRGAAFAGLDTPWLAAVRESLEEERFSAELDYTDVQLRDGQHAEVVTRLAERVRERPMDERLASQHILALHRCGRRAEALTSYQEIRTRLADELGADPGPQLRELYQRLLAVSPDRSPLLPRQLPPPPRAFIGRDRELADLTATARAEPASGATVVISAIGGAGGVGKTWLALQWAHQNVDRFPDGQLYADLHSFEPGAQPMTPMAVLRGFLSALGVSPSAIPLDLDGQSALFRSLTAGRRMLVLLDNALETKQVVPLLPGGSACTVLITSRNKLTNLVITHGASTLNLDVLDEDRARQLLLRHLSPDSVDADAVPELLRHCAGLPLALSIIAARAPALPLVALAEQLRDHSARLDALDTGEANLNLRAVFATSLATLSPDAVRLFGVLGSVPGPDFTVAGATAMAGQPVVNLLAELESAHLIQEWEPGRYRMHELVRLFAAEHAPPDPAAVRRLVDYYLHTAYAGDRVLDPHRQLISLPERPGFTSQSEAIAWFDAEHRCLMASQQVAMDHGWFDPVWQIAWCLQTFCDWQGHLLDKLDAWQLGLAAGQQLASPEVQARAHRLLGAAYTQVNEHLKALEHLREAVVLAERLNDPLGQANGHLALAWARERLQGYPMALAHATNALRLYRQAGIPVREAMALNASGWIRAHLAEYPEAQADCVAALRLFREHYHRQGEAQALDSLGFVAHKQGKHADALAHYEEALELFRALGHSFEEASTLERLGELHNALGQGLAAHEAWQQALALYQEQHRAADSDRVERLVHYGP